MAKGTMEPPKRDTEIASKLQQPNYYNRVTADVIHISRLAEVIRAGANLPPITIDAEDMTIIDGVHRWKAFQKVHGPDASIPVERRHYDDEATRFKEGLEANAGHGRALSAQDMRHSILQAERIGMDLEVVRSVLMITADTFAEYRKQFVLTESGEHIPLSRSNLHLAGQIIPDNAVDAIRHGSGSTIRQIARQLIRHLASGYIDWADEGTITQLQELASMLGKVLTDKVA